MCQEVRNVVAVVVQERGNGKQALHAARQQRELGHVPFHSHVHELAKSHGDRETDHGGGKERGNGLDLHVMTNT